MENTQSKNIIIVDVRSEQEFELGNVQGSINIPLQFISDKLAELKQLNKPIAFCCASGARSGMATSIASSVGIECMNAGSWYNAKNIYENEK